MATLSGTIIDTNGNPVAGARIWTDTYDSKAAVMKRLVEGRSDGDGKFQLGPVEPFYRHRFDLVVVADSFACLAVPGGTLSVYPGRDCDLGILILDRGRVVIGRVLDVDGQPCTNATVELVARRFFMGHAFVHIGPDPTVATDADGRFRSPPLPIGRLSLEVRAPSRRVAFYFLPIGPDGESDVGTIRLEKDLPVSGLVKDEDGDPVAGVRIWGTAGHEATTDAQGRFTLRGFGANPTFQMNVTQAGYVSVVGTVTVTDTGIRYDTGNGDKDCEPAEELVVILKRAGWIEGQVIDADTGEPIRLDKVVVCKFERTADDEVILRGCRRELPESEPGRFRASFSLPDEYHLTISAAGYHDAEAYTPKMTDLATIRGIVVRMKKQTEGSPPAMSKQVISGIVKSHGRRVESAWVGLWALRKPCNVVNAPVMRGRTVVGAPIVYASAPVRDDGVYLLDVPFQGNDWYVVVEEPGQALTQVGPISISLQEQKVLDIACSDGGHIRGEVVGVPPGWEGHAWVVAFSKTGVRAEARADSECAFLLPPLPPGEYGLKVGHDAYEDPEVYPGLLYQVHPESSEKMADPWKRATMVTIEGGQVSSGVQVEWPR